jgi:hypothetical protein
MRGVINLELEKRSSGRWGYLSGATNCKVDRSNVGCLSGVIPRVAECMSHCIDVHKIDRESVAAVLRRLH